MKPKFIILTLTGCSGCISSLIGLDLFFQFLERVELVFFSFLSDLEMIKECDIALIEGTVTEESQINILKSIRKNSKKVYALGSCSAFGGYLNLSMKRESNEISKYIEIDGIIPGCPPPSNLLGNAIVNLIENKEISLPQKNLCEGCPLKTNFEFNFEDQIKYGPLDTEFSYEENKGCFLQNGILCLGPITRNGCDHKCLLRGLPCDGCLGSISKDFTSDLINFLSLLNLSNDLKKKMVKYYKYNKPNLRVF